MQAASSPEEELHLAEARTHSLLEDIFTQNDD